MDYFGENVHLIPGYVKFLLHPFKDERKNSCTSVSFLDIEIKELET